MDREHTVFTGKPVLLSHDFQTAPNVNSVVRPGATVVRGLHILDKEQGPGSESLVDGLCHPRPPASTAAVAKCFQLGARHGPQDRRAGRVSLGFDDGVMLMGCRAMVQETQSVEDSS